MVMSVPSLIGLKESNNFFLILMNIPLIEEKMCRFSLKDNHSFHNQ